MNLELNTEYLLPGELENAERLVAHEKSILLERYTKGGFRRDFHAKTHGGVKARLVVEPDLADEFRHGVFRERKEWPAWIRFSNGGEVEVPDIKRDVRGLAIKLMGVPGEKLLEGEKAATTQDFLFFTPPVFFTSNAFGFYDFITTLHSPHFKILKLAIFFILHPKVFWIIFKSIQRHANLLELQYFSATPYLLGRRAVKYSLRPCRPATSSVPSSGEASANYLRERLVKDLTEDEARFDFLVQFQADPYKTPIEDAAVVWDPSVAPFHKVATLIIPPQTFNTPEQLAFTENLSMNPWHALPEHRPLSNVNRTRKILYHAISNFRHQMNEQPKSEPTAGPDFFDVPRSDPFGDAAVSPSHSKPEFTQAHWSNWEGTYECDAEVVSAESVVDLKAIIEHAKRHGKTIRVSGGGDNQPYSASYSGSPVVQNEGQIIVHLPKMNRGYVHSDGSNRVTVQAGMTLREFDTLALNHGLCLETSTAPNFLQVGGAVALSCHGSGNHGGTLSDQVVAFDVVRADGRVQTITKEHDAELFRAAQVNLGALGIVHTVTFQCVPRFKLMATDELVDLGQTIDNVQSLVESHDYVELFWYPFTDKAWIKKWNKVPWDTPDLNRPDPRQDDFQQQLAAKIAAIGLGFVVKFPQFTPPLLNLLMKTTRTGTVVAPAPNIFHYTRYFPRRLFDLSYAIETGDRFEKFRSAWNIVTEKVCSLAKPRHTCHTPWSFCYGPKGSFPMNFLMHARFFKGSHGYLAPAVDFKRTVMMEAITYIGSDVREFYREIEHHWISLGGRPHWGKTYNPEQDFGKFYGDNITKFNVVREQMDPSGLFLNKFLRHVLRIHS